MPLDSVTEEIRRRTDLVELVGGYVALRPAGNDRFKACCPFHDEKTPSFYVSRDKGFYKCFGCSKSGDAFRFLMETENVPFPEARKILAERAGVKIPERRELSDDQKAEISERERLLQVASAAQKFWAEQFAGNAGLVARDYARKRGLSRETIEKFGLGYAPDAWDGLRGHLTRVRGFSDDDGVAAGLFIEKRDENEVGGLFAEPNKKRRVYDRYRHRLMFPIWDESGRVIAFGGRALDGGQTGNPDAKYINSPETPLFHKSNVLFAWHLARSEVSKRGGVVITEGYMDAIALHEAGFGHTVATLGTALTAQHVALLKRMSPGAVWLCFDGDSAGMKAALRTAPLFSDAGLNVRVVRLPREHDPDTFVREFGADGLQTELENAVALARYRLEVAVAEVDWNEPPERAEAMRAAAEIVNDISDGVEREGYVHFLVDKLLSAEGATSLAERERRRVKIESLVEAELQADSQRSGRRERLREARLGDGQTFKPAPPHSLEGVAKSHEVGQKEVVVEGSTFRPKILSPRRQQQEQQRDKEATDLREAAQAILGAPVAPGVVKAERALLATLIGHPAWRGHVIEKLPLEKWTSELHGELFIRARDWGDDDITPVEFCEGLSDEAQSVVAEIMLGEVASQPPESRVVDDWIARVERHWALQAEREMLEFVRAKINAGETLSEAEHAAFNASLEATQRKMPLPAE